MASNLNHFRLGMGIHTCYPEDRGSAILSVPRSLSPTLPPPLPVALETLKPSRGSKLPSSGAFLPMKHVLSSPRVLSEKQV